MKYISMKTLDMRLPMKVVADTTKKLPILPGKEPLLF